MCFKWKRSITSGRIQIQVGMLWWEGWKIKLPIIKFYSIRRNLTHCDGKSDGKSEGKSDGKLLYSADYSSVLKLGCQQLEAKSLGCHGVIYGTQGYQTADQKWVELH